MQLLFFGSDQYSRIVLTKLVHTTGLSLTLIAPSLSSAVVKSAKSANIKVLLYDDFVNNLHNYLVQGSIGLSASFPRLFPPALIHAFGGRLYNLHPSLLPQYRNVAPVPYALAMGDKVTGISLFEIIVGIDNGPVVAARKANILPADTTPALLERLFIQGAELFLQYLASPSDPTLTSATPVLRRDELIFTRRLTRETGYLEWDIVQKLLSNKSLTVHDTANALIKLRLTHYPSRTRGILTDLIRALTGYETVWTIAPGKKGPQPVSLALNQVPSTTYYVLIPGKPRPISWSDFTKYHL